MNHVWRFGSHTSVSGGLYHGIEAAAKLSMATCQIFTKNASQWNAKPLLEQDVRLFSDAWKQSGVGEVFSHASYLINLASPNDELRQKSIDAMRLELDRGNTLGLAGVVVHPGAFVSSTEADGIASFQRSLEAILSTYEMKTAKLLIENTAGQGTTLGRSMVQLAKMLEPFQNDPRLGLCIDSCHAHAAGYDLSEASGLTQLIDELGTHHLLDAIQLIHLNDSKKAAGSRVDRHEHIGVGTIGLEGISRFIQHAEIKRRPMVLETEKGLNSEQEDWDLVNLRILYGLVGQEYRLPSSAV